MGTTLEVAATLDNSNAFAIRRVIGLEGKNRTEIKFLVERKLIELMDQHNPRSRNGARSDMVNMALTFWMIANGWL